MINVNRTVLGSKDVYEAVRYAWKLNAAKARKAELILAVQQGLIIGAFEATYWLPANRQRFPGREDMPGRWGFIGRQASEAAQKMYVGKRMPERFRKRGAANPVRYSW